MKILNISSPTLVPVGSGGARVIFRALQKLSIDNEVYLLTLNETNKIQSEIEDVKILSLLPKRSLIKYSPVTLFTISKVLFKIRPDLIIFDCPWFGIFGIILRFVFGVPYDIRAHNVEFLRFKRLGKFWWPFLMLYEAIVYQFSTKIRYLTNTDKLLMKNAFGLCEDKFLEEPYVPDNKIFFPNNAFRENTRSKLGIDDEIMILFFGSLAYGPNVQAVDIIVNKIAPAILEKRNDVVFVIVGSNPPKIERKGIIFTGYVNKIEDYINASEIVIVPLISGGGVRTKILETLACGKSVISTKIGAEGITVQNKNLILIQHVDEICQYLINF